MKRSAKDWMILITVCKFRNHPRVQKSKERYKVKGNFSFRLATTEKIKTITRDLPTNKSAGGEIPVHILKNPIFLLINRLSV